MSDPIESLEIQIKSNSGQAVKGIEALATSLAKLQQVSGTFKANGLSSKMKELANAMKPLSSIEKNGLSSTVNALKKFPEVMSALNKVDMGAVAAKMQELATAMKPLANEMGKISTGFSALPTKLQSLLKVSSKVPSSNKRMAMSFTDLYHKMKFGINIIKRVGTAIYSTIEKSSDYTENVNLFKVAMGEYVDTFKNAKGEMEMGANEYADIVSDALGIDTSDWIRAQGVFMTLATGFGVAGERAYTMSKNLTQLGYDISSFYNISVEDAMQKLQSGLSGELEPLRRLGYDLSQAKLEATALELGIDKSVSSMTQAEKAQLRYYAIMTQVTTVQGDMARTLDQPANQIRVLKAQFEMAARSIGNVFIPALNAILPVAIAVMRVVRSLADIIAGLVGYEFPEVDYSGVTSMGITAEDTSDAMEDATESAKKLKSYMLGFDELNVINPNNEGASSAADVGSAFDFELPDYSEKFLEGLADSRVAQIVEEMKEWLGITDDIDSWSELLDTRFGNILKTVGLIGGGLIAWKVGKGVFDAFSSLGSLFGKKGLGGKGGITKEIASPKTILKGLANVAIIVGGVIALVAAVGLLTKIPGFNDTIHEGLTSLGEVFKGLLPVLIPIALVSAGMAILGKVAVSDVAKGLANTAIIIGGTTVLITAIGALMSIPYFGDFLSTGIKNVTDTFNGLYDIAVPIGILSAYMVLIGLISPATIALGLAGFAIVIGGTVALVTAIGALMTIPGFSDFLSTGITSLTKTFNGLYEIATPIGVLSAYLIVLGIATPATILSGLAGFALVIGGFSAILVALGALKQIPGFDWIVDEGAEVLEKLGNALGKFAGSIVGGLAEGITDSFPKIGENLAEFMEKAEPFFDGLDKVNEESIGAIGNLAKMVLTLTAVDVLNGLTSWLTGGKTLTNFGKSLKDFAPYFAEYADEVKDIDADAVTASSVAVQSILEFANNIPNSGGVASWFAGENNIDTFGKMLPSFGTNIKKYADNVAGLDGDVVVNSANAAKSILEIAKNIPNSGGVAAWFAGDNDIEVFGKKLPKFGSDFKAYSDNIKGLDLAVVDKTNLAASSIVALCSKIPNSGGVVSWFTGDNDIAKFGEKLAAFGIKFKEYYETVKSISNATINDMTACIERIIDFAIRVKNDVDMGKVNDFTNSIKKLGKAITDLPTSKTITITVNQINNSSEISSIKDAIGKLPLFASGGFPAQGQMFIAREAGAEMVGSIGRRTAVANNDQIVAGIAGGVAEANEEQNRLLREQNALLSALLEKESGVYIDGKHLTNSVEKYQRERGRVLITGGVV